MSAHIFTKLAFENLSDFQGAKAQVMPKKASSSLSNEEKQEIIPVGEVKMCKDIAY